MKYKITTNHAACSQGQAVLLDETGQAITLQGLIAKKMIDQEINKDALAASIGINRDTIYRFFAGQDLGYKKILSICEVLEIDIITN